MNATSPPRVRVRHGDGCEAASWPVHPALAPYVRRMVGYAETTPAPIVRLEHAAPWISVIIELGPPLAVLGRRFPGGFAAGIGERSTLTAHDGFQMGVQLDLTPIGARRLFRRPLREIADRCVDLQELLPREHRALAQRLAELPDWEARLGAIEALVATAVLGHEPRGPLDLVAWASRRVEESGGRIAMTTLARELGYSPKHVASLFDEHVGVAPKVFARIVRLSALVLHLRQGSREGWADLASRLGFFDQAHLSREVKRMTGLTPTELRRAFPGREVIYVQDARWAAPYEEGAR